MEKDFYCLYIHPKISIDQAWEQLEKEGGEILYSSEEDQLNCLYGYFPNEERLTTYPFIMKWEKMKLPAIDWEAQWQAHGLNFFDGHVHVDLSQWSETHQILRLKPGPGFGDLSHPTTRLILQLMGKYVKGHPVVDIGCGSGVLTLAALAMGASVAYGIDIDPEALKHSKENAEFNGLDQCRFLEASQFHWKDFSKPVVILMNMISSEQKVAWASLPSLHSVSGFCLISGIRQEEKASYLTHVNHMGWRFVEEKELNDWCALVFKLPDLVV